MLTITETAERLGVHYHTARKWILDGKIRALREGRVVRVSEEEVEHIKEHGTRKPEGRNNE